MFAISELAPEASNGASGDHLDVVVADLGSAAADDETSVRAAALAKALAGPGTVIAGGIEGAGARAEIERILAQDGFTVEWRAQASEAVRFDPGGLLVAARDTARVGDAEPAHA
jgi:hypothetical protein